MLSQPQLPPPPSDRALAARRPTSISSRSTTTRRHRSSRSHHGGSSYRPQNEFPNFAQTGDVEIIISADGQERRYMLHRLILAQCSGFFETGTSEEWSKAQSRAPAPESGDGSNGSLSRIGEEDDEKPLGGQSILGPSRGQRQMWRYELDWGNGDEDQPMLIQKPPSTSLFGGYPHYSLPPPPIPDKPSQSNNYLFRSIANLGAMQSAAHIPSAAPPLSSSSNLLRDYDNLFRIFYNHPPSLDSLNIAEAYLHCKSLLALADMYDSLEVVGPRIDHHLLQFQSRLWKQIAKYPPSYLKLGYLARSKVIFSEALVHVVGQWPQGSRQLSHALPDTVLDLIEDKVDELAEKTSKAETQLFRLNLLTSKGERVSPANAYMDWLAQSLFRQYLAEASSPPPPPPLPKMPTYSHTAVAAPRSRPPLLPPPPPQPAPAPSLSSFYRTLFAANQTYLPHDELKKFIRLAPLPSNNHNISSRDALRRLERKVDELKGMAREVVRPLMRSCLELEGERGGGGNGLGYLTCTRVEEGEWPWD
ncbi:MAG: hypothetical protein Q9195_003546 [Heterodermia aff. obscurata]